MKIKNDLKDLSGLLTDIPALSASAEGEFRGGFYAVATVGIEVFATQDSCEDGCQNGCQNNCVIGTCKNSCKQSCQNSCQDACSSTTPTNPTPPTESFNRGNAGKALIGFSFVF